MGEDFIPLTSGSSKPGHKRRREDDNSSSSSKRPGPGGGSGSSGGVLRDKNLNKRIRLYLESNKYKVIQFNQKPFGSC